MAFFRDLLIESGLERIVPKVEASLKHTTQLAIGAPGEGAGNRLGGRPNLPPAFAWPEWRSRRLAFVAQIDLSLLPALVELDLPRIGSLFFFCEGGKDAWGFRPDDAGSSQVLFAPESPLAYPLRDFPSDLPDQLRFDSVDTIAQPSEISIPHPADFSLQALDLNQQERRRYNQAHERFVEQATESFHRVGGYPDCVQGDPKLMAHLVSHGFYCGDQSGYRKGKEQGFWPGAADWELLLQVDSEGGLGMRWGDDGRLFFLIHSSHLRQRRFEKTWMIVQSY